MSKTNKLEGHEVANLQKCEICYDLADKYFGEGNDEDGGEKMHAVDFAHFVIGQLRLKASDWVKTSERMPEPNKLVLICKQYGQGRQEIGISFTTKRFPDIFDRFDFDRITHWAEMPEFPIPLLEQDILDHQRKLKENY